MQYLPLLPQLWSSYEPFMTKKNPPKNQENMQINEQQRKVANIQSLTPISKKVGFIYCNESRLKMMKNAFYFTWKALFVLNIFKFLFWSSWSGKKRLDKIKKNYGVIYWVYYDTHITQRFNKYANQTIISVMQKMKPGYYFQTSFLLLKKPYMR